MTGGVVGGLVSRSVVRGMRGRASKRAGDVVDIETRMLGLLSLRVGVVGANARGVSGSRCHVLGFW